MMRRPASLVACAVLLMVGAALAATQQTAPLPPPPAQFPPLGTGLAVDDRATVQAAVEALAARVAALKRQHVTGPLADRVADVEIYLDAVRRPLKYDERFWDRKSVV